MTEILNALRRALDEQIAQSKSVQIFFRDDDVDEDETSLRHLLSVFAPYKVPLILGVIPARLTTEGIALLNQHYDSGLIELAQHGWQHINHEQQGRKCEFGVSRSFAEQLSDIAQGRAHLNDVFGDKWFPAFIPPWNRCTEATHQALDQLGFQILSKLHKPEQKVTGYQFLELSVTLDLYNWKAGATLRPLDEIVDELLPQIAQPQPIGIMLHHKVMTAEAFDLVANLLEVFTQSAAVRFHTFESWLQSHTE